MGRSCGSGGGGSLTPSGVSWVSGFTWGGGRGLGVVGKESPRLHLWLAGFQGLHGVGISEHCKIEVLTSGWVCLD